MPPPSPSIIELPSGIVINAQIVDNKTGTHDRLKSVDIKNRTVTLSILDGTQGGRQYQEQGFASSLVNGGIDPINVFPLGPDNSNSSESNNYSPLWDAHVSAWTPKAIKEGKVHRIMSMDEQKELIAEGYLTSATGDSSSPTNAFVGGLHPSELLINCPVVAHPELPAR
jgi:hypothetical protein